MRPGARLGGEGGILIAPGRFSVISQLVLVLTNSKVQYQQKNTENMPQVLKQQCDGKVFLTFCDIYSFIFGINFVIFQIKQCKKMH